MTARWVLFTLGFADTFDQLGLWLQVMENPTQCGLNKTAKQKREMS